MPFCPSNWRMKDAPRLWKYVQLRISTADPEHTSSSPGQCGRGENYSHPFDGLLCHRTLGSVQNGLIQEEGSGELTQPHSARPFHSPTITPPKPGRALPALSFRSNRLYFLRQSLPSFPGLDEAGRGCFPH